MKKRAALALAAMMAVGSIALTAAAEETEASAVELKWEDVKDYIEASGIEGDFVTFDEVAVKLWVPTVLEQVDLTDEDKEEGFIGYFESGEDAEEQSAVSVMYVEFDGMDIPEYAKQVAEVDGVSDVEVGYVNGLPCVSYEQKDNDSGTVAFITESGNVLEVTCSPVSSDEAKTMSAFIVCSIMPEDAAVETEA